MVVAIITMNIFKLLLSGIFLTAILSAQEAFAVTGTAIPAALLKLNYGTLPKGVQGVDLNICNVTDAKRPITSSAIFQALAQSQGDLHPIGRQVMLAAILRNQNHSLKTWLTLGLGTTTTVLSVLGRGQTISQSRVLSATGLFALIGQQLLAAWTPVLTADQVEKFESQVLEPALVMDGGSCVERTVFVASAVTSKKTARPAVSALEFHVR